MTEVTSLVLRHKDQDYLDIEKRRLALVDKLTIKLLKQQTDEEAAQLKTMIRALEPISFAQTGFLNIDVWKTRVR